MKQKYKYFNEEYYKAYKKAEKKFAKQKKKKGDK